MESTLFWISPERVRGDKTFRTCSSCGRNLFPSKGDRLEFHGTHPRQVLCMPCREEYMQRTAASTWPNISREMVLSSLRGHDTVRPTSTSVVLTATIVIALFLTVAVAIRSTDRSSLWKLILEIALRKDRYSLSWIKSPTGWMWMRPRLNL